MENVNTLPHLGHHASCQFKFFFLNYIYWSKCVNDNLPQSSLQYNLRIWRPADSLTGKEWTVAFYKVCVHMTNYTSICLKRSITPAKAEHTKKKANVSPQASEVHPHVTHGKGCLCKMYADLVNAHHEHKMPCFTAWPCHNRLHFV